jgi:uncharacterized protein YndB with AHSA1/START domain
VDAVTVRRWVDACPDEVWEHLTDVDALVEDDRELDLLELAGEGGRFGIGSTIILSRHHGPRRSTMVLDVLRAEPPRHLVLRVEHGRARWTVAVDLSPIGTRGCDVVLRAQLDPARPGVRLFEATAGRADRRRLAADLAELLERLARRATPTAHPRVRVEAQDELDVPDGALI